MGAEFIDGRFDKDEYPTKETVRRALMEMIADARYEFGHGGYTGTIAEATGVTFVEEEFRSDRDAEDWLLDNAEKWSDVYVISTPHFWVYGANCAS
jgi:hypothetical protein